MPERSPYRFPHESRRLRSHRESCWKESRDRKSTRLNSSHGYISYAVFCLKKKKQHDRNCLTRHPSASSPLSVSPPPRMASLASSRSMGQEPSRVPYTNLHPHTLDTCHRSL